MAAPSGSIGVIIGSTRAVRVGPSVAAYVKETFEAAASSLKFTLIDITKFKLPVFDEAVAPAQVPAQAQFAHEHSKVWSAEIAKYDGYVIVSPEYNFGTPGGLKNAIDYLYNEWIGKPIVIVTYGIMGGASSSESLKTVLTGMKTAVIETRPQLGFKDGLGPDAFAAMGAGTLGEATKEAWEKEKKGDLLKAIEELKAKLVQNESSQEGLKEAETK